MEAKWRKIEDGKLYTIPGGEIVWAEGKTPGADRVVATLYPVRESSIQKTIFYVTDGDQVYVARYTANRLPPDFGKFIRDAELAFTVDDVIPYTGDDLEDLLAHIDSD